MTPFCLVVSGGSQVKDNDDALLDVVLMFNGGPLGAKKQRFLFKCYATNLEFEHVFIFQHAYFLTLTFFRC